ncbi:MAG: isoprenyl transferase [Nitrospinae bacterium]|nr:isoprenyl transferase [Nitrospinota bacterium]
MIDKTLLDKIDKNKLPRHIAIIMDGNGRWAKKRNLPRVVGHRVGAKSVEKIVIQCRKLGIEALTLYAFSDENWNRPNEEIDTLMKILKRFLRKELKRMLKENIRFNTIGKIENLPKSVVDIIKEIEDKTKRNDGMILSLALSYGSRGEIIEAVKKLFSDVKEEKVCIDDLDDPLFRRYLFTSGLPEPDLLIRTSGELRISNFLLYQIAYTELYFTNVLWPAFRENDLLKAILSFQRRKRRFGLIDEQYFE